MPENVEEIVIKSDLRPSYYDEFRCLAEKCNISCCKGWRISFGKKDYLSLKRQRGSAEFNARIKHSIRRIRKDNIEDFTYAEFAMNSGDCPLLREDGLCMLQIEKGHDALPQVCQTFPRSNAYLPSGYLERSLAPSCEGVLDLLWKHPEGIYFYSDPIADEKEHGRIPLHSLNNIVLHMQEVRSWCIDMLQDRRYPLAERILRMGIALKSSIDEESDISHWLYKAEALRESSKAVFMDEKERNRVLPMFLINNLRVLMSTSDADCDFKLLQKEFLEALELTVEFDSKVESAVLDLSTEPWIDSRKRFEKNFQNCDYFMENLMVAAFFHLHFPDMRSAEDIWKSYVNFCNLYSFYRFMAVMSCHKGSAGDRDTLFRAIVHSSRMLIHNTGKMSSLRDEFFEHNSAELAHMAILLYC